MKILSFNVRQWTRDTDSDSPYFWKKRMEAINKMIKDLNPDILCLQEMLTPAGQYIPDEYKRVGVTVSHPIYIKDTMDSSKHSFQIYLDSAIIDNKFQVINVHSRWEEDIIEKTLRQIEKKMSNDTSCIVAGDFNNDLETINKFKGIKNTMSVRTLLNADENEYTFEHFTKDYQKFAVDHFFIKGIIPISYKRITDTYGVKRLSDHYPILMEFNVSSNPYSFGNNNGNGTDTTHSSDKYDNINIYIEDVKEIEDENIKFLEK